MFEHFTDQKIKRYIQKQMPPDELLAADEHLSDCDECHTKISAFAPAASFELHLFPANETKHLTYEQFEKYADENSGEIEREIADVHLRNCEDCRANLQDILAMKDLIEADLSKQNIAPSEPGQTRLENLRNVLSRQNFMRFGLAAFALLLLVSIAGFFLLTRKEPTREIVVSSSPVGENTLVNRQSANTKPVSETLQNENDLQQNSNANVNLNSAPVNQSSAHAAAPYNEEIQAVLTAQKLNFPSELNQLNTQTGKLMSGGDERIPFALSAPVGKIIQPDRPRFQWRELSGAQSYVVSVYDTNFNKIASSPPISETAWQIDKPLPRGKIYIWQVTAFKKDEEIKSPVRPAPDAKFKILEANKAAEIAEAKRKFAGAPLLVGIMYAKAGLLEEAEREFQKEINKNPSSKTARKFLQDVRARRTN